MKNNSYYYEETKEKIIYYFTLVGVVSTSTFAILNIFSNKWYLGTLELVLSFSAVLNVLFYKKSKNFEVASTNILILVYIVLLLLIIEGGFHNQGIFWIYIFPLLTFFLKNAKSAIIWNLLFVFSVLILLLLSIDKIINIAFTSYTLFEAIGSYLAVMSLSYFYSKVLSNLISELNYKAIYDPLTDIYNRHFVFEYLEKEIEKIKRGYENNLCLIYIDLDNFKHINDKYGHITGDKVLREVANIFKKNFRKTDIVGRIGGDEFLIIIPKCNKKIIELKLNNIKEEIKKKFKKFNLSFSYGIVEIPSETIGEKEAVKLADEKMYKNKLKRKGSIKEPK